ncbi:MAG: hypothetical protein KAR42_15535 [candidate division Zixibacteria bacterium]|nr:hypothetical protein [candidate division Zixibacteria bacterium]
MKQKYWIESLEFSGVDGDGDSSDIGKAVISSSGHGACVVVLGSPHDLTERVIAVINGLNGDVS